MDGGALVPLLPGLGCCLLVCVGVAVLLSHIRTRVEGYGYDLTIWAFGLVTDERLQLL